jgi:tryptophan synthase alpha subunit
MINAGADAIIVASALINIINKTKDNNDDNNNDDNTQMFEHIQSFVASMKNVCRIENS